MIIVIFHVLYLVGKLICAKYNSRKQRESHDFVDTECAHANINMSFRDRNRGSGRPAQPPGDNSDEEKEIETSIKFFPPAYIQRYVAVQKVLEDPPYKGKIRKVVDFGCAELGFVVYLKNTTGVEEILCVDIDKELLEYYEKKASPLHVDYLHTRSSPLTINIIEGSVTHNDKMLEKTDAVICIELIEHLYPETLTDLPYNIFGFIKPQVAIMTTPNVEFNVLFNSTGFRHYDHKFEWTREQFRDWADNIVSRFPDYEVSISGICDGPPGTEHLGSCSQMAVFHRQTTPEEIIYSSVEGLFKIVCTHEYPFHVDNRSDEQKILDDTIYFIRNYSMYSLEFTEEIPLQKLLEPLKKYCITVEVLKDLLQQNGWTIVNREAGPVVLANERSDSESNSQEEDWNDLDLSWNDRDNIEDDWDLDPGPPSHYTPERIAEMSREDWSADPSIVVNPEIEKTEEIEQEQIVSQEINNSTRPIYSEESIEIHENCVSNVDTEETIVEATDTANSSLSVNCSSSVGNSSLTFDFKEVLDPTIKLQPQKLLESDYECQLPDNRSEKISSNEKLRRKTYRKLVKKPENSQKALLDELGSLCSMYLESSRNDNSKTCFQDLSNLSFESTLSATSSVNSKLDDDFSLTNDGNSFKKPKVDDSFSNSTNSSSQFEKLEEIDAKLKRKQKKNTDLRKGEILSESDLWEGLQTPESISKEDSLHSGSQISFPDFSNASISSTSLDKSYPEEVNLMYKSTPISSKGRDDKKHDKTLINGDTANTNVENVANLARVHIKTSLDYSKGSRESSKANESFNSKTNTSGCSLENKYSISLPNENLNPTETLKCVEATESIQKSNDDLQESFSISLANDAREMENFNATETLKCVEATESIQKSDDDLQEIEMIRDLTDFEKMLSKSRESFVFENPRALKTLDLSEISEMNLVVSEILDTPPNSSSPEIMDSGYPNSASAHDMTPEYDLPSIEQDRISDSESPSIEEAPRPGFFELELENGDLANNNRDDEGNNMIPVENNEEDDLQPLINVLENDMENENDIYVLQNGFPAWLLRILQMQEIGIAGHLPRFGEGAANINFNEGFSSSSEDDEVED